jgi:ribosomal protein S18 acetylase RimI-like enzyme
MTSIEVLDADYEDPSHCDGILEIIDSYARDPVGGGAPLPAAVREGLVKSLREHPTTRVLLAFEGDTPVGAAICFLGLSTFRAKPLLNIHDLAVLPAWRGKGVGRALLTAAEERARREGCCKLTLEVQEENLRARGLYESFGFGDFVIGGPTPTRFLSKELEP